MKEQFNVVQAMQDPKLFGSLFKDLETWKNWIVFLKAVFALEMDSKERKTYKKFTDRSKPPKEQFKEVYAVVGRRGGKSYIAALIACFLAIFHDWTPYLAPGEIGWIMVIASDRNQARNILNYIKGIFQLPAFKTLVEGDLTWEIRLNNRISITVKTSDFRTIRGFTVVAAINDEVAFWHTEGMNPAKEILTALRPAMATIPGSMMISISSPYAKTGPLWEAFQKKYGKNDPDTLVWHAPTRDMNPSISKELVDKDLKEDYSAASAEYLARFREDIESYITREILESIVVKGRKMVPYNPDNGYTAFVDVAGGSGGGDSFTLAISHKDQESGKIILDLLEERCPPFDPFAIVQEYSQILRSYGLSYVTGDAFTGGWAARSFEEQGIDYIPSELTKSQIYAEFEAYAAQRSVELLDSPRLVNQFLSLERRTRSGGRDSIDHMPSAHDDLSNVAAGSVVLTARDDYYYSNNEVIVLG